MVAHAGVDDAQAIMLCLAAPDVEVVGISCVAGNVVSHRPQTPCATQTRWRCCVA
jgi:inosine-uridine nucleoside N-ribohydrolase